MIEDDPVAAPGEDIGLLITYLIYISQEIDRCLPLDDPLLELALQAVAVRLHAHYQADGGRDDQAAFRDWIDERWPAPSAA